MFMIVSVGSRLLATLLYLTPSMGLLSLLHHWKYGQIEVKQSQNYIYDDGIKFADKWQSTQDIEYYSGLTYKYYVLIYLALILIQVIVTMFIGWRKQRKNFFGLALDSLLSPAIDGGRLHILIFCLGNLVLMIPIWLLSCKIAM